MKKTVLFLTVLLLTGAVQAQLATIDSRKVVASMPQMAKIDTLILTKQSKYNDEYALKQKNVLMQQTVADSLSKSKPNGEATKISFDKLKILKQDSQEYLNQVNKEFNEFRNQIYKPYLDRINAAIKTVAERRKFMQVVDIQQAPLLYTNPDADITNEVIEELKK